MADYKGQTKTVFTEALAKAEAEKKAAEQVKEKKASKKAE